MVAPALLALAPLLQNLAANGLGLIGNAILAKGKQAVEEKLGVNIEESVQTEEGRVKLMQLQYANEADLRAFALAKAQQEIERERMGYQDVASARTMQGEALKQSDLFSKRFVYYLAAGWSLAAMIYIGCITFLDVPEKNMRFADVILGFLMGTVVAQVLQFFFGSSQGSKDKSGALGALVKKVTEQ